ncbi:polysaccharide deacetylase family protein [Siccirubricoccus sp. KC 17139]|uniref:Chitooligosaccharide deacetylase n=1 Tax=Siccirubricoccus soli TaxID=2899147 RepID=A0ABT1D5N0_9PROT|nr:polysaccharide deacetylase family protein [Siccirubricoccus soli]MCO6417169.1 polysaccharide deacetylase family protein [Siccirubricoccus soli]MCP2683304.1 polysaccharide deacetylase family protein [Siccirubricoccus soli]
MPWKDRYTISDERSLADAEVCWPEGAQLCMTLTVDLSPPCGEEGIKPADLATPDAQYGMHGGLDALLGVLAKHGVRATFAVPGAMAAIHAPRIKALAEAGHEIAAHGWLHEDVSALSPEEEKARLGRTTEAIAAACGARPQGWYSLARPGDKFAGGAVSGATMSLLRQAGYAYMGNGMADDLPHWWVTDAAARQAMLVLPYYYHFDDQFFLLFPAKGTGLEHADDYFRNCRAEFAAQYKRGRQFSMVVHPHAIGFPHRLRMLDGFLAEVRAHPGVWLATAGGCAAHWHARYPAADWLRLEPSIWRDYEDSLS